MIKKQFIFYVMIIAAIYIAINVALFLSVDFERLNNVQFWISWVFMFAGNSAAAAVIGIKSQAKHRNDLYVMPYAAFGTFGVANVIYLVLGVVFTIYLPAWYIVFLVDLVVAIFYAIFIYRFLIVVAHIQSNDAYRRQKVAYIRTLSGTVKSYVSLTDDYDMQQRLKRLASDFEYSDPISHESLAGIEQTISVKVANLMEIVQSGDSAAIDGAVKEISGLLKMRNLQCANLK